MITLYPLSLVGLRNCGAQTELGIALYYVPEYVSLLVCKFMYIFYSKIACIRAWGALV